MILFTLYFSFSRWSYGVVLYEIFTIGDVYFDVVINYSFALVSGFCFDYPHKTCLKGYFSKSHNLKDIFTMMEPKINGLVLLNITIQVY